MIMMPEFEKTKEWKEYKCDDDSPECAYTFGDEYAMGLKKGAPDWLVKAVEEYAEKLRRIREIEEREGVNIF